MSRKGLKVMLVLLCLGTLSGAAASPSSETTFQAGEKFEFLGAGLQNSAEWREPSNWLTFQASVVDVDEANVTFLFQANDVLDHRTVLETYDLATRKSTTSSRHAVLWVNPEDIARGEAFIGARLASLVASTTLHHQFSAGGTVYYYDAETGILAHMADHDNAAIALRR